MKKHVIYIYFMNGAVRKIEYPTRKERDDTFEKIAAMNFDGIYVNKNSIINLKTVCFITKGDTPK